MKGLSHLLCIPYCMFKIDYFACFYEVYSKGGVQIIVQIGLKIMQINKNLNYLKNLFLLLILF